MQKKKNNDNKKKYDHQVNSEDHMRQQKEQEVMQLEMLEMELIKKLQNTQAVQKQAYNELENALAQPSAVMGSSAKKQQLGQPQPE
jgi:hypothetical protein